MARLRGAHLRAASPASGGRGADRLRPARRLGLLVTNVGFTEAARARAAGERGVKIDVVRPAAIEQHAFRAYCEDCPQFRIMQERRIVVEGGELTARGWCAVCGSGLYGGDE